MTRMSCSEVSESLATPFPEAPIVAMRRPGSGGNAAEGGFSPDGGLGTGRAYTVGRCVERRFLETGLAFS
jgi:hypothetical protein